MDWESSVNREQRNGTGYTGVGVCRNSQLAGVSPPNNRKRKRILFHKIKQKKEIKAMSNVKIFDTIRKARDEYAAKYDSITKVFDDTKNSTMRDFKGPRLSAELTKLKTEYSASIQKEREKTLGHASQEIEKLREAEEVKVRVIDETTLHRLKALDGLTLATAEISALINQFSGKSYWTDRYLSQLAEKNGITDVIFPADFGAKMQVLEELENGITDYVDGYCGSNTKYLTILNISDSHVYELEDQYTKCHTFSHLSRSEAADRAIAIVLSQNTLTGRGLALRNLLANADDKLRATILYKLSENESLPDDVFNVAGYRNEFRAFKENEIPNIKAAQKLYSELASMENETDVGARLDLAGENGEITEQLIDVITDAVKENQMLAKACADSKNPRIAELVTPGKGE